MTTHRTKVGRREIVYGTVAVLLLIGILTVTFLVGAASSNRAESAPVPAPTVTVVAPAAPSPIPTATVVPAVDPWANMVPEFRPPNGPDPDDPMYGVDVQALAGEFRTHGVETPPDKYPLMLAMTNRNIARGDNDLDAWDKLITADTRELYPGLSKALVIDVARCWAEYDERVVSGRQGLAQPPDSDDHNVTVSGRGPQARVVPR